MSEHDDIAAKAHDDEVYAIEQDARNIEAIGGAIALLQRTDSRRMPDEVRNKLHIVRASLSLAQSLLGKSGVHVAFRNYKGDGTISGPGVVITSGDYKVVPKHEKTAPSLGAQLADLRTIIDKVEAARTRVAQRYMTAGQVTLAVDSAYDVIDLLVDARQTAIDLRDEVERTLAGKFLTLRDLKIGDCFRFKSPPPGWTDGKLQLVEGHPGFAMPPGWDFFPIELLDGEVEKISPSVIADEIRAEGGIDRCDHCGAIADDENSIYHETGCEGA